MDRLVGQVFNGKYRLVREIGSGGMGVVYEAEHLGLNTQVALKTLLPRVAQDELAYDRFRQEARAASRLRHPHIAAVIDFDHSEDGLAYMVMEFLEGRDLSRLLRDERRVPAHRLVPIIRKVCSGVHAAHQHHIVHRDLKPQNIFLCNYEDLEDFPKILDFGISKILDATGGMTETNATLGTPYYMAPEQAEGRSRDVDARTDVYSLGAMVYRALAGRHAFSGTTPLSVVYQVAHGDPDPLQEVAPDVDPALCRVVHRAMSRQPDDRHTTAMAFAEALGQALAGWAPEEDVEEVPGQQPRRPTGKTRRGWSADPPAVAGTLDNDPEVTEVDTGGHTRARESGQEGSDTDVDHQGTALSPQVTASQELTEQVHLLRNPAQRPVDRPTPTPPRLGGPNAASLTDSSDTEVVRRVSKTGWTWAVGGALVLAVVVGGLWLATGGVPSPDTVASRDSGPPDMHLPAVDRAAADSRSTSTPDGGTPAAPDTSTRVERRRVRRPHPPKTRPDARPKRPPTTTTDDGEKEVRW